MTVIAAESETISDDPQVQSSTRVLLPTAIHADYQKIAQWWETRCDDGSAGGRGGGVSKKFFWKEEPPNQINQCNGTAKPAADYMGNEKVIGNL